MIPFYHLVTHLFFLYYLSLLYVKMVVLKHVVSFCVISIFRSSSLFLMFVWFFYGFIFYELTAIESTSAMLGWSPGNRSFHWYRIWFPFTTNVPPSRNTPSGMPDPNLIVLGIGLTFPTVDKYVIHWESLKFGGRNETFFASSADVSVNFVSNPTSSYALNAVDLSTNIFSWSIFGFFSKNVFNFVSSPIETKIGPKTLLEFNCCRTFCHSLAYVQQYAS